jgi:hypothetical protein
MGMPTYLLWYALLLLSLFKTVAAAPFIKPPTWPQLHSHQECLCSDKGIFQSFTLAGHHQTVNEHFKSLGLDRCRAKALISASNVEHGNSSRHLHDLILILEQKYHNGARHVDIYENNNAFNNTNNKADIKKKVNIDFNNNAVSSRGSNNKSTGNMIEIPPNRRESLSRTELFTIQRYTSVPTQKCKDSIKETKGDSMHTKEATKGYFNVLENLPSEADRDQRHNMKEGNIKKKRRNISSHSVTMRDGKVARGNAANSEEETSNINWLTGSKTYNSSPKGGWWFCHDGIIGGNCEKHPPKGHQYDNNHWFYCHDADQNCEPQPHGPYRTKEINPISNHRPLIFTRSGKGLKYTSDNMTISGGGSHQSGSMKQTENILPNSKTLDEKQATREPQIKNAKEVVKPTVNVLQREKKPGSSKHIKKADVLEPSKEVRETPQDPKRKPGGHTLPGEENWDVEKDLKGEECSFWEKGCVLSPNQKVKLQKWMHDNSEKAMYLVYKPYWQDADKWKPEHRRPTPGSTAKELPGFRSKPNVDYRYKTEKELEHQDNSLTGKRSIEPSTSNPVFKDDSSKKVMTPENNSWHPKFNNLREIEMSGGPQNSATKIALPYAKGNDRKLFLERRGEMVAQESQAPSATPDHQDARSKKMENPNPTKNSPNKAWKNPKWEPLDPELLIIAPEDHFEMLPHPRDELVKGVLDHKDDLMGQHGTVGREISVEFAQRVFDAREKARDRGLIPPNPREQEVKDGPWTYVMNPPPPRKIAKEDFLLKKQIDEAQADLNEAELQTPKTIDRYKTRWNPFDKHFYMHSEDKRSIETRVDNDRESLRESPYVVSTDMINPLKKEFWIGVSKNDDQRGQEVQTTNIEPKKSHNPFKKNFWIIHKHEGS